MGRENSQLFGRGESWYGPDRTIDANDLEAGTILGQEKEFEDLDYSASGVKGERTNQRVRVRAVRNSSGTTLYAKEYVQLNALGTEITGRVVNDSQHGYPLDEYLPAGGLRPNDVAYVVVEGPAMMITPTTGAAFNSAIGAGDPLHSVTTNAASTEAGTTSAGGRVAKFATGAATTNTGNAVANFVLNCIGVALSAKTTGNTNADILVDVRRRF